ncbi:WD40 repeat-like protein [Rickenella mellea]|uniref:WD40 repeat-like protein n=1 Tax=Rickenella mellea TaxID=50990 RepID=A0A4Y7QAD2_9AGAM|nr:WD40 repeat-like protein [Rickenella mellea]
MSETTIATGTYTIENVDRRNDIFLADDRSGTLVAGSSEADADPPLKARWIVSQLRNGRYTFSPATQRNLYASWPTGLSLGSAIVTSPTAHDWVVKETRVKETFVISHVQHQLYWGFEEDAQGTPVRLRYPPTGTGNRWRFLPCLESNPDAQRNAIGSPAISRSEVDWQTASESDLSQSRKLDDGWPATCQKLEGHADGVYSVAYSPDGKRVVSGSWDRTIRVWDVRTMCIALEPIEGHYSSVNSVAFSPDGKWIVSGSWDKTVRIWDSEMGTLAVTLNGHTGWVMSVACSPSGKRIVSGSTDKTVCVWDVETERLILGPLLGHTGTVHSVKFSTDGKQFLSCSKDTTICVWDAESGVASRTFNGKYSVCSAIFSPDSKQIVSGDGCGIVTVWDMQSSDSIILRGHSSSVLSVGMSPDGERIVSGRMDNQIIVWDAKFGHPLGRLIGHSSSITSVKFSPDGRWITSGSSDKTVRIWDAAELDAMPVSEDNSDCVIC